VIADLLERWRALVTRRRWHRDLDEEMRFHVEQDVAARIAAGTDPATAQREARLAFGGAERYHEATRDASGVRLLDDASADARFALRALRRNPGFTATAVLVLALAIGATTAVFTVIRAVLLADLPYPQAGRLVRVFHQNSPTNLWGLSVADVQAIQAQQRTLAAFGVAQWAGAVLTGAGEPEQVVGARATAGFFQALAVATAAGRLIEPRDEPPGAPSVVVVSHAFAAERLGGAAAALGRTILLNDVAHTVVGVLRPGVRDLAGMRAVVWTAFQMEAPTRRGPFGIRGFGRLRDGVTLADAGRDLAGISERIFPLWESGFKDKTARYAAYPLRETIVGNAHGQLRLLGGAVALVLLAAVANVATLLLVRTAARRHELAVRAALGASRPRLARLVVTESLVLTLGAAAGGLGLAALGLRLVGVIAPNLPRAWEIAWDGHTALLALALGVVCGLLVSVSPVAAVLGRPLAPAQGDTRRAGGGRRGNTARGVLVAAEFALAVPLLLAAGLLANSFLRLQDVDPGYDAAATFAVPLSLPARRYPDSVAVTAFWQAAVQRTRATPGVVAAGFATSAPPDNQGDVSNFNLVAHPVPPGGAEPLSPWSYASPGFFEALGIPLLDGRVFTEADSTTAPPVAIVSRAWAQHYFPGEPAVGQLVIEGGCYECPRTTIVGVVGDVKYQGLAGNGDGVYVPLSQSGRRGAVLFVRTAAAPEGFIRPVLDALRGLDPELPLRAVTMTAQLRQALADPGRWTAVLAAFAVAALALAAMGVFGLMSYAVRRQRREIGVRLALGAEPRHVIGMIVARGMRYVAAGTLVGLGLAVLAGRWLAALLYGVTPRDPGTLAAVSAALLMAALLACLLPGMRAAHIRPIEALADD
jgi:putative ABC transport system permease protein